MSQASTQLQVVQEMNRSSELVCSYLPLILIIIAGISTF